MDQDTAHNENQHADDEDASKAAGASSDEEGATDEEKPRRRRRRRGGRRRGPKDEQNLDATDDRPLSPNSVSSESTASGSLPDKRAARIETETDAAIDFSTRGDVNTGTEEEPNLSASNVFDARPPLRQLQMMKLMRLWELTTTRTFPTHHLNLRGHQFLAIASAQTMILLAKSPRYAI